MYQDIKVSSLKWDEFNRPHISLHKVQPNEVEEAILSTDPQVRRLTPTGERWFIYGVTIEGRWLTILIGPTEKPEEWYPITARDCTELEMEEYVMKRGGVLV